MKYFSGNYGDTYLVVFKYPRDLPLHKHRTVHGLLRFRPWISSCQQQLTPQWRIGHDQNISKRAHFCYVLQMAALSSQCKGIKPPRYQLQVITKLTRLSLNCALKNRIIWQSFIFFSVLYQHSMETDLWR